eukprot:TRINITY_DN14398_c0_g4_i2.p1 TRINITY_DN14398_c0_g4~~TRINITY_DN14398_c0_g4_i2.p1  ORF type:complete len:653 (+),score=118.89 TRINITY_DN14398_c0_g4_i2:31-1959(+)
MCIRDRHKEEVYNKLKSKLGMDKVQGKVFQSENAMNGYNKALSTQRVIKYYHEFKSFPRTVTTFKANGSVVHKEFNNRPEIVEESANLGEKKAIAAESIFQKQQEYIKQLTEKKNLKERQREEEQKEKERKLKRLASQAKAQIHELYEEYSKQKPKLQLLQKPQKLVTRQQADKALENFLARNTPSKKSEMDTTNFTKWKRRRRIPESTRVFIITGGYFDLINSLRKRGWVENEKSSSSCFDLKWTIGTKEIDYGVLESYQAVNHFDNNTVITTKVGLCHHLRNLIWYNNVDVDTFYPRSFDLIDTIDAEDFIEEFKNVRAEGILKEYSIADGKLDSIAEEQVIVVLSICERRLRDIDDVIDSNARLISNEEWEVINNPISIPKQDKKWLDKLKKRYGIPISSKKKKPTEEEVLQAHKLLLEKINTVLSELANKFPQFKLNGHHNVWIVKPAGMSRGRGIKLFSKLKDILGYAKTSQCVVQKYIENPMIIKCRKFDIRQWVLVTSFCPLTIWFYDECYVRFSAAEYRIGEMENRYIHLTNNSVAKHYEGAGGDIKGNMWDQETFEEYLKVVRKVMVGNVRERLVQREDTAGDAEDRAVESGVRTGLRCQQRKLLRTLRLRLHGRPRLQSLAHCSQYFARDGL